MILDIIALVIIAFCIYMGMKKGLVGTLFSSLSFVVALVLTITTLDVAFDFAKTTEIGKSVYENMSIELITEEDVEKIPPFIFLFTDAEEILDGAENIKQSLSEALGDAVLKTSCAVLLFVLYSIVIKVLSKVLDAVAKLPLINMVNKVGGILAGVANAWVFLTILTCLLTFMVTTKWGETLTLQIEESFIVKWFCDNNPLL